MRDVLRRMETATRVFPLNKDIRTSEAYFVTQFRDKRIIDKSIEVVEKAISSDPGNLFLKIQLADLAKFKRDNP